MIAIYALNTVDQRKSLWEFVGRKMDQVHYPLLVGGDFNVILSMDDRS